MPTKDDLRKGLDELADILVLNPEFRAGLKVHQLRMMARQLDCIEGQIVSSGLEGKSVFELGLAVQSARDILDGKIKVPF